MIQSLEKLEVYKKARVLRKDLLTIAKMLPDNEKYRLTDQLI